MEQNLKTFIGDLILQVISLQHQLQEANDKLAALEKKDNEE